MTTINASNFSYVQFCQKVLAAAKAQGLQPITADTESGLPQNDGWCFLRFAPDGAALIIPKGKTRMGNCHSHVDLSGKDGFVALPKKNGKVICHFESDADKVSKVLSAFVGAAKRATLAPTPKATVAATPSPTVEQPAGDVFGEALEDMLKDEGTTTSTASEDLSDEELELATQPVAG